MNRRDTLIALGALTLAPLRDCIAQVVRTGKVARIASVPDMNAGFKALFAAAMKEQDWVEGRNYEVVQVGFPFGPIDLSAMERLIATRPDLIYVGATSYAIAAQRLSSTIPIVMWASGFPVAAGVADSLAHPGRNVTGMAAYEGVGIWGKIVQLLVETKPSIKRIGMLHGRTPPDWSRSELDPIYTEIERAARRLGKTFFRQEVGRFDQVPAALAALDHAKPDAMIISGQTGLASGQDLLQQWVLKRRLPVICDVAISMVEPVIRYSAYFPELIARSTRYVTRILNGEKPGDLPIQLPTRFEMIVNLKSAKAIGLKVPQSVILQANKVIE